MKYVEELSYGQIFQFENLFFVLTSDFKKQNSKNRHLCIQINTGSSRWLESDMVVELIPIFYQDANNVLYKIENDDSKTNN